MAQKGQSEKGRSLNSIKLRDFPENEGLADDFYDREVEEDYDESETVIIPKSEISENEDGSSGLQVRSVARIFGEEENKKTAAKKEAARKARAEKEKAARAAQKKKPVSVNKIGKKKHSVTYKVIKFCIFLLLWVAVAFACYQGYKFAYRVLDDEPMDASDVSKVTITVTGDETDAEMGDILLANGLIDDLNVYKLRCILYSSDYVPGTYELSRSFNTEKNLNILAGYDYSDGSLEDESDSDETAEETTAESQSGEETDAEAQEDDSAYEDDGVYEDGGEEN